MWYAVTDRLMNTSAGDSSRMPSSVTGTPSRRRIKTVSGKYQIDDQETNDQTKAVHFLLDQGKKVIILVGATGKREDHTLGNISLLVDYMKVGAQVTMLTDHGMFVPASGRNTFKSRPGQQVSVFNFGATGLRGEGLVYPLSDFDNWWQGTLNEATGDEFTIHAEGDYLVYLNY